MEMVECGFKLTTVEGAFSDCEVAAGVAGVAFQTFVPVEFRVAGRVAVLVEVLTGKKELIG